MMLKEGFIIGGEYTQTPDYEKLNEILKKEYPLPKSLILFLRDGFITKTTLVNSRNKLTQAYKAISMKVGDYIYVRGKKGIISEGWLFQLNDTNIEYVFENNKYWSMIKFKTIGMISNDDYLKIHAKRASFGQSIILMSKICLRNTSTLIK